MTEARGPHDDTPVIVCHDVCGALRRYGRALAHEISLTGRPVEAGALVPTRAAADARLDDSLRRLVEAPRRSGRPIHRASLGYASTATSDEGRDES